MLQDMSGYARTQLGKMLTSERISQDSSGSQIHLRVFAVGMAQDYSGQD